MEPCGTPLSISMGSDVHPPHITLCVRFERKEDIQLSVAPLIP